MYTVLLAEKAFMIPMPTVDTKMTLTGNERDDLPEGLENGYDLDATADMVAKNNAGVSAQFVYIEATLDPIIKQIDKADERSGSDRKTDTFWFKATIKNGAAQNNPGDYVVRPCPPFCGNTWAGLKKKRAKAKKATPKKKASRKK